MSKNDERILKLKEQIEKKTVEIKNVGKFVPETNCILELDSKKYNINTFNSFNKDEIIHLLVKLNAYRQSASVLGVLLDYNIGGYNIELWIKDLKSKLLNINVTDEKRKLVQMEAKLSEMLSEEKKTELQLDEFEDFLK